MPAFPHLELKKQIERDYKHQPKAFEQKKSETTEANLNNRQGHSQNLSNRVDSLDNAWNATLQQREQNQLPPLPHPESPPLFLQVDPLHFDIESLISFGIEIIAEKEGGFVVGASADDFKSLRKKIDAFANEKGRDKDQAAKLWQIVDGSQWRVEEILSEELRAKWPHIQDDELFILDVSIATYLRISKQPGKLKEDTDEVYEKKLERWETKVNNQLQQKEELALQRQTEFEEYLAALHAEMLSSFVEEEDSFGCRISITGKGLRDLTLNYPHIFDITEQEEIDISTSTTDTEENDEVVIIAPQADAPKICVIDSGIQENHRFLQPAIDAAMSKSFLPNDASVADQVVQGGHGTRVAGAILYPNDIPRAGQIELPFFIQNARVLDGNNGMPSTMYPPELMQEIVDHYTPTRVFNLSIASRYPCRKIHMSQWASAIDRIMHESNVLFIIAAGNLRSTRLNQFNPGIVDFLASGNQYPTYLLEASCRIANPSQSSFALTVGSVCIDRYEDVDRISFGEKNAPSAFSRTGLGLWNMIKPDVVEYGGDWIREKIANPNLSYESITSPELIKSTGTAYARDNIGTSFAAPKVTHIAAQLQKLYAFEDANLYRALIVQSARLPGEKYKDPRVEDLRYFGYGIPNLERATKNTDNRITLIATTKITAKKAHVYSVRIPEKLRRPGDRFNLLVEVSLAFTARPRRTRRRLRSYLSTWLSWESSKLGESLDLFQARVLKEVEADEEEIADVQGVIPWLIREQTNYGKTGLRRQDNSVQKSWCILESNQLTEEFSLAVVGHKGWNVKADEDIPYALTVSFEALEADVEIYEAIRVENKIELPIEQEVQIPE